MSFISTFPNSSFVQGTCISKSLFSLSVFLKCIKFGLCERLELHLNNFQMHLHVIVFNITIASLDIIKTVNTVLLLKII